MGESFLIVMIEDNPADADLIERVIGSYEENCHFKVLSDGQQAMDWFTLHSADDALPLPDLVLLDLHIPRVESLSILQAMRNDKHFRKVPILVFSTSGSPEEIDECYRFGATAFLFKPLEFDELDSTLKNTVFFWLKTAKVATKRLDG